MLRRILSIIIKKNDTARDNWFISICKNQKEKGTAAAVDLPRRAGVYEDDSARSVSSGWAAPFLHNRNKATAS